MGHLSTFGRIIADARKALGMSQKELAASNVRDGALRRQNRVLIWIDGHLPPRVTEFYLTDWIQEDAMHGQRIG